MRVEVRKAEISDVPGIVAVWIEFMAMLRQTNSDYWVMENGESAFNKYLEEILDKDEQLVAVAVEEKKVIGFSLAYIETLPEWFGSTQIGLIRYLAVSEGARGKGIGDQIFTFIKGWFSSFGIKRIELYVLKGLQASDFWQKLGFTSFMDRRFLEL